MAIAILISSQAETSSHHLSAALASSFAVANLVFPPALFFVCIHLFLMHLIPRRSIFSGIDWEQSGGEGRAIHTDSGSVSVTSRNIRGPTATLKRSHSEGGAQAIYMTADSMAVDPESELDESGQITIMTGGNKIRMGVYYPSLLGFQLQALKKLGFLDHGTLKLGQTECNTED